MKKGEERDLWHELDKLAFWLCAIGIVILSFSYFLVASLLDDVPNIRNFVQSLITELIPVLLLFALSYAFLRRINLIRSRLDLENLADIIVSRIESQIEKSAKETSTELRNIKNGMGTILEETQAAKVNILFISANPWGTEHLRIEDEIRGIREGLKDSQNSSYFHVEQEWGVRKDDLQRLLIGHRPKIVHFSGHASAEKGISLEDRQGAISFVSGQELGKLLFIFRDSISLVFLNANSTSEICKNLGEDIDYTIGASGPIADEDAVGFSSAFYHALGNGYDVDKAFELGCARILNSDGKYMLYKPKKGGAARLLPSIVNREASNTAAPADQKAPLSGR